MTRRYYVMTDLEGVVGVDSWSDVRHSEADFEPDAEAAAKAELAREVNACIEGIRRVDSDAVVEVIDGHGQGGLEPDAIEGGQYCRPDAFFAFEEDHVAQLYVGQHAMAGTAFAPLRHTMSSTTVEYYKLNGTFIGEFGGGAIRAGVDGVPTIFLAGDDKACHEAEMVIPEIETVAVKYGQGEEAANHRDLAPALAAIRDGAARAVERLDEIRPVSGFEPPFTLEIRYQQTLEELPERYRTPEIEGELIDPYTIRAHSTSLRALYP